MTTEFSVDLARAKTAIQMQFDHIFATQGDQPVHHAMAYACGGGKRLRGYLVLAGAALHDVDPASAILPACAIEAIHAYSLIHDDLPCMDDDDLRRGQPTVHIKWDDATAVLAGDALQSLAFELLGDPVVGPADVRCALSASLARAAGARGMVLGQALDMAAETADTPLTLEAITALQNGKTGALITWAATAGARLGGADTGPLTRYADALGLAFQIADDILDETGDEATAGKRLNKDAAAGKATFVSLLGLDGARSRAKILVEQACDALSGYGTQGESLRQAARFVISRQS